MMLDTRTPAAEGSEPSTCVWNTTWRALYGWPSGPATDSALARLLATTFRRWLCALAAEPDTLKMFIMLMTTPCPMSTSADPPRGCGPAWERPGARPAVRVDQFACSLPGDRRQRRLHLRPDEAQRGFVLHG